MAYKLPRTELKKCKGRDDLSQSVVYFLFSTYDQTGDNLVYIGQAGVRKSPNVNEYLSHVIMNI